LKDPINEKAFKIKQLNQSLFDSEIYEFLVKVFFEEQNIPKELIPLETENQIWWGIIKENQIVGTVAAWKMDKEWNWGRLALAKAWRGKGLGLKLVTTSLESLFESGIEEIVMEARDITVEMIIRYGGKITGDKTDFYGNSITPMRILKKDFVLSSLK